jgi:hypothetical protein
VITNRSSALDCDAASREVSCASSAIDHLTAIVGKDRDDADTQPLMESANMRIRTYNMPQDSCATRPACAPSFWAQAYCDQITDLLLKWIEKHIEKKSEDAVLTGLVEVERLERSEAVERVERSAILASSNARVSEPKIVKISKLAPTLCVIAKPDPVVRATWQTKI